MAEMKERELLAMVNAAKDDAVKNQGEFMRQNEDFLKRYLGDLYGDEMEGQSQVVSSDVADVVESDMPSLVRIFLGSNDIMFFEPVSPNQRETEEAEQKSRYINWLIRHQRNSFRTIHGWIKDTEIQKVGVLKYEYIEEDKSEEIEYDGLDDIELALIIDDLKLTGDAEIIGQDSDDDGNYIKFRVQRTEKKTEIRGIPNEDFIISRNAKSKDDAEIVGDRSFLTRGELIAQGYEESLIRSLPARDYEDKSNLPAIRFRDEGGEKVATDVFGWATEEIEVFDLYILVDFDGDGITERRRIILAGNRILDNDHFGHVPYAINSAILMPHQAIGRSRAEVTMQTQRIKTVLYRQILDNIYRVNGARVVVNDEQTNIDDLLVQRPNGIIRTTGEPHSAVAQLETPYIGDKALQVVQYVDSVRAQTTGAMMANQGLEADNLYKETATRFEGVEAAAAAKVELVARVIAETGMRDLFEGLVWLTSRYNNDMKEILVTGKPIKIRPRMWRHESHLVSNVGLAAGDNEQVLQNMGALLSIQNQLKQTGSLLVDEKKTYNVLTKTIQAMGLHKTEAFFNDPEQPDQLLLAQNEKLMGMVEQLQQQAGQNPFTEPELIKAQAALEKARGDNEVKLLQASAKQQIEIDKLSQNMRQFGIKTEFDYTKLELEQNADVPGKGVNG
ncbi:MAG: hypothetical protein JKX91_06545 [Rhizobiaceae bacterium]|nr:hypothetical protein [Rhizobiaceae bacterium]